MSDRNHLVLRLLLACVVLVVWAPAASSDCPPYLVPTQRFGVDLVPGFGHIDDYDVASLHIAWYSDWWATIDPPRPGGIEYVPLITIENWAREDTGVTEVHWHVDGFTTNINSWGRLEQVVAANPGSLWLIGNEPECPNYPGGGNLTVEMYVPLYHDLYHFIKNLDSTARIANGGVVEPTPLRLLWLDNMLQFYQDTYHVPMPVDVWTTHVLILQEDRYDWGCGIPVGLTQNQGRLYSETDSANVAIFQQLVVELRTWMNARGLRDKPLWITEYGVLMPDWYVTDDQVKAFMTGSFDYLLSATDAGIGYPADGNRLVQRWAWNSLNDQPYQWVDSCQCYAGFNGSLFLYSDPNYPGTLTTFGQNFKAYTDALLTGTVCLAGTVHLDGRPAAPHSSYVTDLAVTLYPVGCSGGDARVVTTNTSGEFTLCAIAPGTYDVRVKNDSTLATRTSAVALTAGSTPVDLGLLRSGDANNDNCVGIVDFSILAAAYGTTTGETRFDARADMNGDGLVDILDFSWLATRYGECGAP